VTHLINAAGEEVYSVNLSGPVISDAFNELIIDKKRKLQITNRLSSEKIYGIDRLEFLCTYPISINFGSISQHLKFGGLQ